MGAERTGPKTSLAARNGGAAGLVALALILCTGLGLRIDEAWPGRAPVYDAAAYARIAANLEDGDGFTLGAGATQPASNYSPGVPLLAAGLYELSGGVHERLARLVLAIVGTLSVLFGYLIARRLSGVFAGLFAAGAVAIYPALLEYQGMLMGEPLAAALLSGAVLAMLWASDSSAATSSARWLAPGALLGALTLIRPEYLGISVLLGFTVLAAGVREGWRRSLSGALLLLLGVVVLVAPWTLRNAIALDRFVPVSTGGGQVLFAGSYLPSGGDPEAVGREVLERHPGLARQLGAPLPQLRLEQILAALARQRYPAMETDEALAKMGRERLWSSISEQPLDYLGFLAAKTWRIWGHGPRDVMRAPVWEILHWLLLALAVLGLLLLARRRRRETLLLVVLLLAITGVGDLLVATPRRSLVAVPILAALAGVGATCCRDSLARWHR